MHESRCRCVSELSTCRALRATRPVRGSAPHAYTCRTNRDLCHWLRSAHRRAVYRPLHVYESRLRRRDTAVVYPRIYPGDDDHEPDRRSFTPADRRLLLHLAASVRSPRCQRVTIAPLSLAHCSRFVYLAPPRMLCKRTARKVVAFERNLSTPRRKRNFRTERGACVFQETSPDFSLIFNLMQHY